MWYLYYTHNNHRIQNKSTSTDNELVIIKPKMLYDTNINKSDLVFDYNNFFGNNHESDYSSDYTIIPKIRAEPKDQDLTQFCAVFSLKIFNTWVWRGSPVWK